MLGLRGHPGQAVSDVLGHSSPGGPTPEGDLLVVTVLRDFIQLGEGVTRVAVEIFVGDDERPVVAPSQLNSGCSLFIGTS